MSFWRRRPFIRPTALKAPQGPQGVGREPRVMWTRAASPRWEELPRAPPGEGLRACSSDRV